MNIDSLIGNTVAKDRETGLRESIGASLDSNPEQAAQADTLARRYALPHDTAERNLPTLATRAKAEDIDYFGVAQKSPKIADYLQDPINAKISHDDIQALQRMELKIGTRWRDYGQAFGAAIPDTVGAASKGLGRWMQNTSMSSPMPSAGENWMGVMGPAMRIVGHELENFGEYIEPIEERQNFGTDTAGAVGQFIPQAAVAIGTGGAGTYAMLAGQGLDMGYQSADRNHAGGGKADATAMLYAGATAVAEKYGLDAMMKGMPAPVKKQVTETILRVARKVGVDPKGFFGQASLMAANTAYGGGVEGLSEVTEGFFQNLTDKLLLDENKGVLDGLGYQGAVGATSGTIISAFVNMLTRGKARLNIENTQDQAAGNADSLKGDIEAVRAPMTAQRSPERMQQLVQSIAGNEDLYFSGPELATLYQSVSPEEQADLNARIDGLQDKIALAGETGSDVSIPKAEFLAKVAPLPIADKMVDLVKQAPTEVSQADLADPARVSALEDQYGREAQGGETDEVRQMRIDLEKQIAADLVKTGTLKKADANKYAKLAGQFYINSFGENAADVYRSGVQMSGVAPDLQPLPGTLYQQADLPPVELSGNTGAFDIGMSANTASIEGINRLAQEAAAGDVTAHQTLNQIGLNHLRRLLSGVTSARIKADFNTGLYGGYSEPSLGLNVEFDEAERPSVLAGLARFASNFNQDQVHVRQPSADPVGTVYDDGSFVTPGYKIALASPLSRKEIEKAIEAADLPGLTFNDQFVEAYYVGQPDDAAGIEGFFQGRARLLEHLGDRAGEIRSGTSRFWAYGNGAIPYEQIAGDVRTAPVGADENARLIGERHFGDRIVPAEQAAAITQEQRAAQQAIADEYEELPVNDMANPLVKRAYRELAEEVEQQYRSLPIKVEIWDASKGEPYKNSDDMRIDVQERNHLFIYATTPESFGPAGVDFTGHPLLEKTGIKDINGIDMLANDLFRAVHDYYAHNITPTNFGPRGEEAAWKNHLTTIKSPWARWALTSETRGQNSWVNFGKHVRDKQTKITDRPFADQKAALLPIDRTLTGDNVVDDPVLRLMRELTPAQRMGSLARPDEQMMAPNGKKSNLSSEHWKMVRTPEFKAWFGDWEKFADMTGGVWNDADGEVSKVVDENGEPLLVYHGSEQAGFGEFNHQEAIAMPGAQFFAADRMIAATYSGSLDEVKLDINAPTVDEDGYDIVDYESGIYSVFLNIRNPLEEHFEGANWDGTRRGMSTIWTGDEQYYAPDGTGIFPDDEAENIAAEIGGDVLSADTYRSTNAVAEEAMEYGHDGAIVREVIDNGPRGDHWEPTDLFITTSPKQIKAASNRGTFDPDDPRILYQGGAKDFRGFLTPMEAGKYLLALSQRANKSTVLHEFGHLFLYQMRDGVRSGKLKNPRAFMDAVKYFEKNKAEVVAEAKRMGNAISEDDVQGLLMNGMFPASESQRQAYFAVHELFARNFEQYLRTGKTASPSLRRLMQTFKRWLTQVYRTAGDLNAALDPELVEVFDRMLASEEQVQAASAELSYQPLPPSTFDNVEDYQAYMQQLTDSVEGAKEDLLTEYLDNLDDERSEDWKKREAEMLKTVTLEVMQEPVYSAIGQLSEGTLQSALGRIIKLDKKQIEKRYGATMIGKLNKHATSAANAVYSVKNGYDVDQVADVLGWPSADAMIRAIADAEPVQEYIDNSVQWRMREKYGNPDPSEETARVAVRNDRRALALATELQNIGRKLGREYIQNTVAEATQAAMNIIGRRKVRDAVSSATFLAAERRAANAAFMAADKGDWEIAYGEKQKQIANYYLWKAAREAEQFEKRAFKKLAFLKKSNADLAARIDGDYADLMRMMMAKIGMTSSEYDATGALEKFRQLDPVDQLDMSTALTFLETVLPNDYHNMKYDDFRDSVDAIMNVNALGRARREAVVNGEKIQIQDFRDQIAGRFMYLLGNKESMVKYDGNMSKRQAAKAGLLQGYAWLRRVEYWASAVEGDNLNGPLHRMFGMVKNASLQYRAMERDLNKRVFELLKPIEDAFTGQKIAAPELGGFTFDNVGHVIGMMYHLGNESNLGKLLGGRDEEITGMPSWTIEGVQAFVRRLASEGVLEKRHMDHVQAIWDLNEELKPAAQKVHKELYGFRFNEITAQKLLTPWGEYRGGYFPARTDAMLVEDQQINQARDALTQNNNTFMFPSTGRGFTQQRVEEYTQPLDMNAKNALSHIQSVNRFINLQPAIRTAGRILNDRDLRNVIAKVDPFVVKDTLIPWLQRAALQSTQAPSQAPGWWNSFATHLRSRSSAATMLLNISNTMQQITAIGPAMHKVGILNYLRASATYLKNPLNNHRDMREMSAELRQRATIFDEKTMAKAQEILNGTVFTEENGLIKNGMVFVDKASNFGAQYSFITQTAFQSQLDNVVWLAAFNQALNGKVRELGAVPTDAQAQRYADKVLRETQISNAPEDVSRFEVQAPTLRLLTLFAGWFNGMLNLTNSTVSRLVRERGLGAAAGIAYAVFMIKVVPYVGGQIVADALRGNLPDDDDEDGWIIDDWASYTGFALARGTAAEVPFIGQIATFGLAKLEQLSGRTPFPPELQVSAVASVLARGVSSVWEIPQALFGDGDESRAWRDGLTMFQLVTGLPVAGQVSRTIGYAADVSEGDTPAPENAMELIGGAVGGTPIKK